MNSLTHVNNDLSVSLIKLWDRKQPFTVCQKLPSDPLRSSFSFFWKNSGCYYYHPGIFGCILPQLLKWSGFTVQLGMGVCYCCPCAEHNVLVSAGTCLSEAFFYSELPLWFPWFHPSPGISCFHLFQSECCVLRGGGACKAMTSKKTLTF